MADEADQPLGWSVDKVEFGASFSGPLFRNPIFGGRIGDYVAVRLASEKKTYLGILLGDMAGAMGPRIGYDKDARTLKVERGHGNPAMFVPDLTRVVFGYESWWRVLRSAEDLGQISDADIDDVWYVRALKALRELDDEARPTS